MTFLLPKKTLRLWQLRAAIVTLLPAVALCAVGGLSWLFLIISGALVAICAVLVFVYLPLFYKSFKITVSESAIEVENGVIIRVTHIMPYPRLIYAGSFATPLSRLMGLECVTLKAARSRLFLPEIERADAKRLLESTVRSGEDSEN